MAVPLWIKSSPTTLMSIGSSSLLKIELLDTVLRFWHSDSTVTDYPYPDAASALGAFNVYWAYSEAPNTSLPKIAFINPSTLVQANLPLDITITGANFDTTALSAAITISGPIGLAIVSVTSNEIVATVPNTALVGVYNVLYSDANGNTDLVVGALTIV